MVNESSTTPYSSQSNVCSHTDPTLNPIVSVSQKVCSNESVECIVILHNLVEYVFHHISTQNNTLSKTRMEYKMNILWQFSSLLHLYVVPTLIERPAVICLIMQTGNGTLRPLLNHVTLRLHNDDDDS